MFTEPNDVELRTTIPASIDTGLARVVELSGVSKASIVREALAAHLGTMGFLAPDAAAELSPTRTGGRGLVALRKDKR